MEKTSAKRTNFWPTFGIIAVIIAGAIVWLVASEPWKPAGTDQNVPPSEMIDGQIMTLNGTIACLPHKGDGPHTMECAYGLEADGTHYGLKNLTPEALDAYQTGSKVIVTGSFTKAEANEKYDIVGTIDVTEISAENPDTGKEEGGLLYENKEYGFSLNYDDGFNILSEDENARLPWSSDSSLPGRRIMTLSLPASFMPKTNFADASVSVGTSSNAAALADCITGEQGTMESKRTINGTEFTVIKLSDAGAGNLYETRSYRVLRDKVCFALETTIHSTNIGNYSPEQGISEFDKAKIEAILEAAVSTMRFSAAE